MKTITLTRGYETIVDDEDYENLARYRWIVSGPRKYAIRSEQVEGKRTVIRMHRVILGLDAGEIGDHINGNGLDNRRVNLRRATHRLNVANVPLNPKNTSGYRGVQQHGSRPPRFVAVIYDHGKLRYLGSSFDPIEAAQKYDDAAREIFGEFARVNFPLPGEQGARP